MAANTFNIDSLYSRCIVSEYFNPRQCLWMLFYCNVSSPKLRLDIDHVVNGRPLSSTPEPFSRISFPSKQFDLLFKCTRNIQKPPISPLAAPISLLPQDWRIAAGILYIHIVKVKIRGCQGSAKHLAHDGNSSTKTFLQV